MDQPGAAESFRPDLDQVGSKGGGRQRRSLWVVPFLVAAVAGAGVFLIALRMLPGPSMERTWSAADGTPVPGDFLFLMFPANDHVPIYDSAGGKQVGVLERALGNQYNEIQGSRWVQVPAGAGNEKATNVRISDLRYLSAATAGTLEAGSPRPPNYVAAFAAAYRAKEPGESRTVTYAAHRQLPENVKEEVGDRKDGLCVTLSFKANGNRRDYHALVTAETAVPLAIDRLYEGSKFSSSMTKWIIAGGAGLIGAVLAWLLAAIFQQRRAWGPSGTE